jgi:hypothetical protein
MSMTSGVWIQIKSWWKSKLIWVGILTAVLGFVEYLSTNALLSDAGKSWALMVVGVLTVVLRWTADTKVGTETK